MFLLWFACMWATAATELGPDQWVGSVISNLVGMQGVLLLVYTAGIMFVLRFFAGPVAHRLSPMGLLTLSSILSAIGLYWLSSVSTPAMAFAAATVFGVGKTYFWPTMLGVTSERFPKAARPDVDRGGAGTLSVGLILPLMGAWYEGRRGGGIPPRGVLLFAPSCSGLFLYYRAKGATRPSSSRPSRRRRRTRPRRRWGRLGPAPGGASSPSITSTSRLQTGPAQVDRYSSSARFKSPSSLARPTPPSRGADGDARL
jgi:MFS family permease